MRRFLVRQLALGLTIVELFSCGLANAETNQYTKPAKQKQFELVDDSNPDNKIYKRLNPDTGEYEVISAFDDRNVSTRQYGANQNALSHRADTLLLDPLIVGEISRLFPYDSFESKEVAAIFYKLSLETIGDSGCGVAAITDYIFHIFEGHEDEFYEYFGFPMYSVAFEYVDFNYELFMIKYFYYHIEKTKHVKEFKDYVLKLTYEYLLKYYTDKLELLQSGDQNYYQVDDKRSSKWKKTKEEYETKIKEYKRKLKGKSNKKKTFTIPLNNKYGELAAFLKKYQININIAVKNGVQGVKAHCVLASTDFKLAEYGIDEEALFYKGGHYMYITEVGKGRQIIVSSWGNKYIFNGSGAKEVKRVLINNTTKK